MDSQEIDEILFETATGIDAPEAREAFFDLLRDGDASRAERLRGLLTVQARANRFFREAEGARTLVATEAGEDLVHTVGPADPLPEPSKETPGECIGRYRLDQRIGEGGCGVVYLAEQIEPVQRQVALKVIRRGMDTERVIERFELERQSLALMDHPNIARVLDGGATENSLPYFVMEWVRGSRITDYCDENRFTVRQRIDLFIEACKGIQHAHQKGVIHRDIKPSNILVSDDQGKPIPKVIDFGVAKAISGGHSEDSALTSQDQFVGTPAYMSPEQADRKEQDVDTRSDVYSLGVLLYELLVGRTPFGSGELAAAGMTELRRILMECEPPSPVAALASMGPEDMQAYASCRHTDPAKLQAAVQGDLNSVVMKAIEKDPRLRYETVNGFVMDLQRYIAHEPVIARPRNQMYLVRKFIRRNRVVVGAATGIVLSLLLGLGTAFSYYLREREAREEQLRLHEIVEKAHAGELESIAKARGWEDFAQVSLLLSEGKTHEADEQLRKTPLTSIRITPQSSAVLRSLGNWNALRGRWQQAAECFRMLMNADDMNQTDNLTTSIDLVAIGTGLIEGGAPGDYVEFREWAIDQFGNEPAVLDVSRLLHAVLLAPMDRNALKKLNSLKPMLENTEFDPKKLKRGWDRESAIWRTFGLALLEFRQGHFEKSREWAERGLAFKDTRGYITGALEPVHAMACFRLGDIQAAEAAAGPMRERIDKAFSPDLPAAYEPFGKYQGYWWDWIIARILFREAESLIEGEGAAPE